MSRFPQGDSDRYYYSVDGHGVALAAIQALNALVQEQKRRIETLEREQHQLRDECLSWNSEGSPVETGHTRSVP